jgi:Uma2 family endonuclease
MPSHAAGISTMASVPKLDRPLTLEAFLKRPEIEEAPVQEFINGRIEYKAVPQTKHAVMTKKIAQAFDGFAEPRGIGESFPELRCNYLGRSIVPDVAFLVEEHIEIDEHGEYVNRVNRPPDLHVEIVSPEQSPKVCREKLAHSTAHGCSLGLFIDPERKSIEVYRPGVIVETLAADGAILGDPVLPGFRLEVGEVFGWLQRRRSS